MHDFIITIIRDHHIWYTYLESSQRMGVPGLKRQFFGMSKLQNKKCECNPQSIVFRWLAFLYATEYSYHVYVHVNLSLSCRNKVNQLFNVFILLQINSKIQN